MQQSEIEAIARRLYKVSGLDASLETKLDLTWFLRQRGRRLGRRSRSVTEPRRRKCCQYF